MSNRTSVSGSKFSVRTKVSAPSIKNRAKYLKKHPVKTVRAIIKESVGTQAK